MFTVHYGGKRGPVLKLEVSPGLIAVRSRNRGAVAGADTFGLAPLSARARALLAEFDIELTFPELGVEVLRPRAERTPAGLARLRDATRAVLKREAALQFAGRVLRDKRSKAPVLYTENLFVKFHDDTAGRTCRRLLREYGLETKRELEYARNAYFVGAQEGTGTDVFPLAERLLGEAPVELCHPELVRRMCHRAAFAPQWHLHQTVVNGRVIDQHANVVAAWDLTQGQGTTIAVIDDGVDIDHQEFSSAGKLVAPRDATARTDNPRPGNRDDHGTSCAGVACADGSFGASGVAPRARLMPIRLKSGLGSQSEADAFVWAAQHGADVISCSWGPDDGDFQDPADPVHHVRVPLPDSTRLAIDWVIENGRGGRGCAITFAAGNGNESVDNDGYASYSKVIAVAACNDVGKKSPYSDFGAAVWCAFPSNNAFPSLTPGIWTTDRSGNAGDNPGNPQLGDAAGNYRNNFGGTSSACPGVAGVAALVLARNPELRWDQVKDILRRSCDRIDTASGQYDAAGHSPFYGFGRINARKAVQLAMPVEVGNVVTAGAVRNVAIRDLSTARMTLRVGETQALKDLRVTVAIEHTFIRDLVVSIRPPTATGVHAIVLHDRAGGATVNLTKTYDVVSTPALGAMVGKSPAGTWTLIVSDKEAGDVGTIRSLSLAMLV